MADMSVAQRAESFGVRPFAPLDAEHPLARDPRVCPVCSGPMGVGAVVCLLVLESEANRRAADAAKGGAYNAEATPAHWACVTGSEDPEGDYLAWSSGARVER